MHDPGCNYLYQLTIGIQNLPIMLALGLSISNRQILVTFQLALHTRKDCTCFLHVQHLAHPFEESNIYI